MNELTRRQASLRYFRINFLLGILYALLMILPAVEIFSSFVRPPTLKERTGTMEEFEYRRAGKISSLFGVGSRCTLLLSDGDFFETTGIYFDSIDPFAVGDLKKGDTVTVRYREYWSRPGRLYGIEAGEAVYQDYRKTLAVQAKDKKDGRVWGIVFAAVLTAALFAGVLINRRKNKPLAEG